MIKKLQSITGFKIILINIAIMLLLNIFFGIALFILQVYYTSTEQMQTIELNAEDFELVYINKEGELYISSNHDPQMILKRDIIIKNIVMEIDHSIDPGEITVYYSNAGDGAFSEAQRIWFTSDSSGNYVAEFNLFKNVDLIRIDPTSYGGNTMDIGKIIINEPKGFLDYFTVTPIKVYYFVIITLLLSACMGCLRDLLLKKYENGQ